NTHLDRDEAARSEDALRLSLARDVSPHLALLVKLEGGRHADRGAPREIVRDEPWPVPAGDSSRGGLPLAASFAALGLPAFESRRDHRRQAQGDTADKRVRNLTLELVHEGDAHRLTLLGGLLSYDFAQSCDCDFTPAPFVETHLREDYRQFSQELRLES